MIREIKNYELGEVIDIVTEYYSKWDYPVLVNRNILGQNLASAILSGSGIVYGLFKDDKMIGEVIGFSYNDSVDGELVAVMFSWHCTEDNRDTLELFDKFEEWALHIGASRVTVNNNNNERLTKFYTRKKYAPVEMGFIKEL